MKRITWLTADYFLDVDIQPLDLISRDYSIDWHIILPTKNARYGLDEINNFPFAKNINIKIHAVDYRSRNLKYILFYLKLCRIIKAEEPDVVYLNLNGFPYFAFICALLLDANKTIFAVHQAKVHQGMRYKIPTILYFRFKFSWFKNFNLFSVSHGDIFKREYPKKKSHIIPLGLKNFGTSKVSPPEDKIVFFNFGTIIKNKNIGLLIKAACNIHEKGIRDFIVKIFGSCDEWNQYAALVRFPEIFQLRIESIANDEIPELFCGSHYLVLPYSSVSQSGPLKIAYNYNIPVIASDLREFKNEIQDNITGYIFESLNVKALEDTMIKAITNHREMYPKLKANLRELVKDKYSSDTLREKYCEMLNSI